MGRSASKMVGAPDDGFVYKAAGVTATALPQTPLRISGANDDDNDRHHHQKTLAGPGAIDAPRSSSQDYPITDAVTTIDMDLKKQLQLEKERYPGARTWARDEERLFELLFSRQDLPILPYHWELDLRGVPISEVNFADATHRPLVYAHAKDFLAATALVRLIELTAKIRTTSESGLHHRVPGMIKDGLDQFLAWAAEDGGYSHLRVVPNIITEVIDTKMQERDITALLQGRMRALGRLQREYLREDRDPRFWDAARTFSLSPSEGGAAAAAAAAGEDEEPATTTVMDGLLLQRYLSPRKSGRHRKSGGGGPASRRRRRRSDASMDDELATLPSSTPGTHSAAPKRRRTFAGPTSELDELATPGDAPSSGLRLPAPPGERKEVKHLFSLASAQSNGTPSPEPAAIKYRRPLPVVYGLFVLNTSVFVLTADSSRGDTGYVSFHVETDFMEHRQSVWNALTLAIVVCMARDELRLRADDFDPQDGVGDESDPDV